MDDPELTVDVVLLEPEQFRRSKPGRSAEDHHRSVHRSEPSDDRLDLRPGLERPLLLRPPLRVRDTVLRRVEVEKPLGDRAVQDLTQRLRRLEAMPFRDRQAPLVDVLRRQVRDPFRAERVRCFAEQPDRSFAIVTGSA